MKKNQNFYLRLIISGICLSAILLYYFLPDFKVENMVLYIFILGLLPWLNIFFESVEIPGFFKGKFKEDSPKDYIGPPKQKSDNESIVKFNELKVTTLKHESPNQLSFKARINYTKEAGATYILGLYVNEVLIDGNRLINKSIIKKYKDGREAPWYSEEFGAWSLQYSPDFKTNYFDHKYKVVNGDPYSFVFNVRDILPKNGVFEIKITHEGGRKENKGHENPIIFSNLELN
jgi:hypothetical protein